MTVTAPARDEPSAVAPPGAAALGLPSGEGAGATRQRARGATMLTMALLLAADAMVLAVLLAVTFAIRGGASSWPPKGVKLGTYLPTVVTVTAIMSAVSAGWALFAIRRNDQRSAALAMAFTVFFGVAVANAQVYSLTRASFGPSTHVYGTLYHVLIGYHIAHVLLGIAILVVLACRSLVGHFSVYEHEPVKAGVLFWQFGNLVWVAILTTLFVLSHHAA